MVVAGSYWVLATLPWVLWHLLPGGDAAVFLRLTSPSGAMVADLFVPYAPDEVVASRQAIRQLAAVRTSRGMVAVIEPRLLAQMSLSADLRAAGLTVARIGPLLWVSADPAARRPSFVTAMRVTFASLWGARQPLWPTLIATLPSRLWGGQDPIDVVGVAHRGRLQVLATTLGAVPVSGRLVEPRSVAMLDLSVPGEVLRLLPEPLAARWNEELRRRLQLTATTPDLVSLLASFPGVQLRLVGDDGVELALTGDTEQATLSLRQVLEAEERTRRPRTRAFRLPDGTIGRERIPGEPEPLWVAAQDDCERPATDTIPWWLCRHAGVVQLAMVAPDPPRQPAASVSLFARPAELLGASLCDAAADGWCRATEVHVLGDSARVVVTAELSVPDTHADD